MDSNGVTDFFGNINIERDLPKVARFLESVMAKSPSALVISLVGLVPRQKFFTIPLHNNQVHVLKQASLSSGELIATAFANILRHVLTHNTVCSKHVVRHCGYVDDTLTILKGKPHEIAHFLET